MKSFLFSRKNEILSGLIFVAVFYLLGYVFLNPNDFFARDDGIITMSHAKNLVDYGFIGVSPSGERVSGTSAPLQLAIYAITYFLFRINPYAFTLLQTIICTFLLGYIFAKFFTGNRLALIYSAIGAFCLTRIYTFLGWHASGMENALFHVLFLWTVYILYSFVKNNQIRYLAAIIVFLAAVVRFDSVYHIAPLLAITSIYWMVKNKSLAAFKFSLLVGAMWTAFIVIHYLYFGSFFPNTAPAQAIDLGNNLYQMLTCNVTYLKSRLGAIAQIIGRTGVVLLPIVLLLTRFFARKPPATETKFLYGMCLTLIATGISNPWLFGITRIDWARTTTFLAVMVVLFSLVAASHINFKQLVPQGLVFLVLTCGIMLGYNMLAPAYYLGWSTDSFNSVRLQFTVAAEQNHIHRATVSNPDLGILSWHKQFNVVDLGMIGSPLIALIAPDDRLVSYYFDYAAPDLVETHNWWSLSYQFLFYTKPFHERYTPLTEITYFQDNPRWAQGMWIRKDMLIGSTSAERRFHDRLAKNLTVENIEQEFKKVKKEGNHQTAYISRTVYRFIPELKEKGLYDDTQAVFTKYHASEFDQYLLNCSQDAAAGKELARLFNERKIKY